MGRQRASTRKAAAEAAPKPPTEPLAPPVPLQTEPPPAGHRQSKRKRGLPETAAQSQPPALFAVPAKHHAYFSCFDEPDALVEIPLRLLHAYSDCVLAKQVLYDRPSFSVGGSSEGGSRPVWRAGMRRAVLLTIVNSLLVGHLVSCAGASVEEVLSQLSYQGLCVSARGGGQLQPPVCGAAFQTKSRARAEVLDGLCGQIADAVACWPRLEQHLWDALEGRAQAEAMPSSVVCSSSRVWVRLCPMPPAPKSGRTPSHAPSCYTAILEGIGYLHASMLGRAWQPIPTAVDSAAFLRLKEAVRAEALGAFFPTRFDREHDMDGHVGGRSGLPFLGSEKHALQPPLPAAAAGSSGHQSSTSLRTLQARSERFSQWVCNTTMASASAVPGQQLTDAQRFANEVFKLAVKLHCQIPDLVRLFGGACTDAAGASPERAALATALRRRGVRTVQWYEGPPRSLHASSSAVSSGTATSLALPVGWAPARDQQCSAVLEILLEPTVR